MRLDFETKMKLAQTNLSQPAETRPAVAPRLECGDMSPLSADATCRVVSKRGHVRALHTILKDFRIAHAVEI